MILFVIFTILFCVEASCNNGELNADCAPNRLLKAASDSMLRTEEDLMNAKYLRNEQDLMHAKRRGLVEHEAEDLIDLEEAVELSNQRQDAFIEVFGAGYIKLLIDELNLPEGVELLISSASSGESYRLGHKDNGLNVPALSVDSERIRLSFVGPIHEWDSAVNKVLITKYWTDFGARAESICGQVDYKDAECFKTRNPTIYDRRRAIGRLRPKGCTVWRISSGNRFMTNNHCISSSAGITSLEVMYNYQRDGCNSNKNEATTKVGLKSLLKTSQPLDYTVFTVQDPTKLNQFGWTGLDISEPTSNKEIFLIHHPRGLPKKITYDDDFSANKRCVIKSSDSRSLFYTCDSEPGSSGSAMFSEQSNRAIGLHKWGGCTSRGNGATRVDKIWPEIKEFFNNVVPKGDWEDSTTPAVWGDWSNWSDCDCSRKQVRSRKCKSGTCIGLTEESRACEPKNGSDCPSITFEEEQGSDCGHGNDISCGRYSSKQAIQDACEKDPKCLAYSIRNNKAWCMKHKYIPNHKVGGHNCWVKKTSNGDKWSDWSKWTKCSVTCGGGLQERTRVCNGNKCVGDKIQIRACNEDACPATGEWSNWGSWGSCSKSCNSGTSTRTRVCKGGRCAGSNTDTKTCNIEVCPTDPGAGDYKHISPGCVSGHNFVKLGQKTIEECRKACDENSRCLAFDYGTDHGKLSASNSRRYKPGYCMLQSGDKYAGCDGGRWNLDVYIKPKTNVGSWNPWATWGACSKSCGSGNQSRKRTCQGTNCIGKSTDQRNCNSDACKPVSGKAVIYSAKTECARQQRWLGKFSEPEACLKKAAETRECTTDYVMFSTTYNSWGCRCCASGNKNNYKKHNLWNVYTFSSDGGSVGGDCPIFNSKNRCGPLFENTLCNGKNGALYCNEANGWCGNSNAHKNAQASTKYDFSSMPQKCVDQPKSSSTSTMKPKTSSTMKPKTSSMKPTVSPVTKPTTAPVTSQPTSSKRPTSSPVTSRPTSSPTTNPTKSEWAPWGSWSKCDAECGVGEKVRNRVCVGNNCDGDSSETNVCKGTSCPKYIPPAGCECEEVSRRFSNEPFKACDLSPVDNKPKCYIKKTCLTSVVAEPHFIPCVDTQRKVSRGKSFKDFITVTEGSCPKGSERIKSSSECRSALELVTGISSKDRSSVVSDLDRPTGCSFGLEAQKWKLHYNTNTDSIKGASASEMIICAIV